MNSNFETKLCKLLIELKSQYPHNYNKIISMLEFVFKDIKVDYLDKEIDLLLIEGRLENIKGWYEQINVAGKLNKSLNKYFRKIVVEDGIIDILLELGMEKDSRFIEKFFEAVEVPIDILKRKVVLDTKPHFYLTNIYAMLCAYRANKDNYENYEALVNDISLAFIKTEKHQRLDESHSIIGNFEVKKNIISKMVAIEDYHKLKEMRNYFCTMFHGLILFDSDEEKQRLDEMFCMFEDFYKNKRNMEYKGKSISSQLEKEIISDISLLLNKDLLPGVYPYYSRILLYGNRYRYFKEKIQAVKPQYRKEVFDIISKLNIGLFAEINKNQKEDSFNECMNLLFDSDTYKELLNKLNALTYANQKYENGEKEEAIQTIASLNDDSYKESHNSLIIAYPPNTDINKKDKPKTIDERMKELYLKNDLLRETFDLSTPRKNIETLTHEITLEMVDYNVSKLSDNQQLHEEKKYIKKKGFLSTITPRR